MVIESSESSKEQYEDGAHVQTVKWIISGRVQGVGFRYFTQRTAIQLGVTGRVQNLPNGKVQVIAMGKTEDLATLKEYLYHGPSFAHVSQISEEDLYSEQKEFSDFSITP